MNRDQVDAMPFHHTNDTTDMGRRFETYLDHRPAPRFWAWTSALLRHLGRTPLCHSVKATSLVWSSALLRTMNRDQVDAVPSHHTNDKTGMGRKATDALLHLCAGALRIIWTILQVFVQTVRLVWVSTFGSSSLGGLVPVPSSAIWTVTHSAIQSKPRSLFGTAHCSTMEWMS